MSRSIHRIIDGLVQNATRDAIFCGDRKRAPGYFIKSLDEKDREELKKATSKDFQGRVEKDKLPIP